MPHTGPARVTPRKLNRYFLSLPVNFMWGDAEDKLRKGAGLIRDMSMAAAFVVSPACPPADTIVRLEILLPSTHTRANPLSIRGVGRVIRVESDGADASRRGFAVVTSRFVLYREATGHADAA